MEELQRLLSENVLHHPLECDFRKIESIPHKSQNF